MSKAFVKEEDSDGGDEDPQSPPLPPSGKNYITPAGYARLEAELRKLVEVERPEVEDRRLGRFARRSLRERRLHLRQAAPARDRPPRAFPHQAAGKRGNRALGRPRHRPDLLWRHRAREERFGREDGRSWAWTRPIPPKVTYPGSRPSRRRSSRRARATPSCCEAHRGGAAQIMEVNYQ